MKLFKSLDKRRWGTAAITLMVAFCSAYVTQNFVAERSSVTMVSAPIVEPGPLPLAPAATLYPPPLSRPPVLADRVSRPRSATENPGCRPQLAVNPAPAATLRIELTAPCHGLVRVHFSQGEVTASMATDRKGNLSLRVPAFSTAPTIDIAIAGMKLTAQVDVPEAESFEHVALQWSGEQALKINAYEFGAQKSQFGHVWAGAPKSPARASRGSGGFLTRLGDGWGNSVEIYSFPARRASTRGVVRLVVEAEVTRDNCGQAIKATALQSSIRSALRPTLVDMTMPGCDKIGQTVHLQNLFEDMRLARR